MDTQFSVRRLMEQRLRPQGKDFLTSLFEWKIKTAAYEVAGGHKISEPAWVVV